MKLSRINKIIITCVLIGIATVIITRGISCRETTPARPIIVPPKEQVKAVENNEAAAAIKTDSLEKVIAAERQVSKSLHKKLIEAQATSRQLEANLKGLVDLGPGPDRSDTGKNLAATIYEYIETNTEKDSLCNELVHSQETQISLKDSIIEVKNDQYRFLRQSFNTSINNLNALSTYATGLEKQLKRKKAATYVWKGAAVGAGLFILKLLLSK